MVLYQKQKDLIMDLKTNIVLVLVNIQLIKFIHCYFIIMICILTK